MKPLFAASLATTFVLVVAGTAFADSTTAPLGGPVVTSGGYAASSICPGGAYLAGVTGALRNIGVNPTVAVAGAQCSDGTQAGAMGDGAGTPGGTACPAGQYVIGMEGRQGDFIDQISLRCQPLDFSSAPVTTPPWGGVGGGPAGPFDCAPGSVAVGFSGQVIDANPDHVRYVVLHCVTVPCPLVSPHGPLSEPLYNLGGQAGPGADAARQLSCVVAGAGL